MKWTINEILVLLKLYENKPPLTIAREVGKTSLAVKKKIQRLKGAGVIVDVDVTTCLICNNAQAMDGSTVCKKCLELIAQ